MTDHWLVIGASSSMARAFIRAASTEGVALTLVGRDEADLCAIASDARIRGAINAAVVVGDVASAEGRRRCFDAARSVVGALNVLLAVGQMPDQSLMDEDSGVAQQMLEATYTGPVLLLQQLAPLLEERRKGAVVIIGSVAGDRGRRRNFLYGSAKAGLATYGEGLRARLFSAGIGVMIVKPGFVDTAMTFGTPGLFLVASPDSIAGAIIKGVRRGQMELYHPWFWRYIMLVVRCIPAAIMQRLKF